MKVVSADSNKIVAVIVAIAGVLVAMGIIGQEVQEAIETLAMAVVLFVASIISFKTGSGTIFDLQSTLVGVVSSLVSVLNLLGHTADWKDIVVTVIGAIALVVSAFINNKNKDEDQEEIVKLINKRNLGSAMKSHFRAAA